jgi:hypothetical protein
VATRPAAFLALCDAKGVLQIHSGVEAEEIIFFFYICFTACAYSALAIRLQIALTLPLQGEVCMLIFIFILFL